MIGKNLLAGGFSLLSLSTFSGDFDSERSKFKDSSLQMPVEEKQENTFEAWLKKNMPQKKPGEHTERLREAFKIMNELNPDFCDQPPPRDDNLEVYDWGDKDTE